MRPATRYWERTFDSGLGFESSSDFDSGTVAGWSEPSCSLRLASTVDFSSVISNEKVSVLKKMMGSENFSGSVLSEIMDSLTNGGFAGLVTNTTFFGSARET